MNPSLLIATVVAATASFAIGIRTPLPIPTPEVAVAPSADNGRQPVVPGQGSLCSAMAAPVEIDVVPVGLSDTDDEQTMALELEVANHSENDLKLLFSIGIEDDEGRVFVPPVPSKALLVIGAERTEKKAIGSIPAGLPDGYYVAHVRAAWKRAGRKEASSKDLYFRVEGGKLEVVSGDDWLAQSNVMVGQSSEAFESEVE